MNLPTIHAYRPEDRRFDPAHRWQHAAPLGNALAGRMLSGGAAPARPDATVDPRLAEGAWSAPANIIHPMTAPLLRQRFFPAQWRRQAGAQLEKRAEQHGLSIQWLGWQRSLPRLYLPASLLTATLVDAVDRMGGLVNDVDSSRKSDVPLRLSTGWRVGTQQCFELKLYHPQAELEATAVASANASGLNSLPLAEGPLARIQRHAWQLGGRLSASLPTGGGTELRLELPVDHPDSMVPAWLAGQLQRRWKPARVRTMPAAVINLFVIGRRRAETSHRLQAADVRLQSLSRDCDLVVRAGYGRWLWLTAAHDLPGFVKDDAWMFAHLHAWRYEARRPEVNDARCGQALAAERLAGDIARAMQRAIGMHVPPLDRLTIAEPTVVPQAVRVSTSQQRRVDSPRFPASQPHVPSALPKRETASPARWRYPI